MASYRSEKGVRIAAIAAAVCLVVLVVVLLVPKRKALRPLPPPAILSFVGLSNMPPFGMMTAFRFSNAGPATLIFAPKVVRYRGASGTSSIPVATIANCAGILAPSGTYIFFLPAIVTNGSLEVGLECRGKARPGSLDDTLGRWFKKADGGKADVWLGDHFSGVVTESGPTRSSGRPADVRIDPSP